MSNGKSNRRTPGAKPGDPKDRVARVATAVKELEKIGAAFTVAEVAELAGISRATIYRDSRLRDIIGARGDVPRPVDPEIHTRLTSRHQALKSKNQELRRQIQETEQSWEDMRDRACNAEQRLKQLELQLQQSERRANSLAAQLARGIGSSAGASMTQLAAQLGTDALKRARRQLALALHPDQYSHDAAAAALATEILKTLNSLAD